jgi:hypothetical protein
METLLKGDEELEMLPGQGLLTRSERLVRVNLQSFVERQTIQPEFTGNLLLLRSNDYKWQVIGNR